MIILKFHIFIFTANPPYKVIYIVRIITNWLSEQDSNLRPSGYERRFSAFEKFCKLEFLLEFVGIYRFGQIMVFVKIGVFMQAVSPNCPQFLMEIYGGL